MQYWIGIVLFIFVISLFGVLWWHEHSESPHHHFFHKTQESERPQHHHFYKYHRVIEPAG